MLTREETIAVLREKYPYLAAHDGVRRIGLFGSYAHGTPSVSSDVDLVIEFDRPIGFQFVELSEYLESALGKRVDILTPAGIQGIRIRRVAEAIEGSVAYV